MIVIMRMINVAFKIGTKWKAKGRMQTHHKLDDEIAVAEEMTQKGLIS